MILFSGKLILTKLWMMLVFMVQIHNSQKNYQKDLLILRGFFVNYG